MSRPQAGCALSRLVLMVTDPAAVTPSCSRFWHNCWVRMRTSPRESGVAIIALCFALVPWPVDGRAAEPASVTFTLSFPGSDPENYSISVASDGHAVYECAAKIPDSEERVPYRLEFDLSPANRTRIFDLTTQANFFTGKIDSGNRKLAFTGAKKLTYRDGTRANTSDYNYSSVPAVQQLTAIFQSMANTLEFGRRLTDYHRYQKLALDEELKRMESQARDNQLNELQAVQSVLQQIVDDSSVINVVRARAQRLIEMGKSAASARR
jgi:hypothetical protein